MGSGGAAAGPLPEAGVLTQPGGPHGRGGSPSLWELSPLYAVIFRHKERKVLDLPVLGVEVSVGWLTWWVTWCSGKPTSGLARLSALRRSVQV